MVENNADLDAICSVGVAVADCVWSASARTEDAERSAARRQEKIAVLIVKVKRK